MTLAVGARLGAYEVVSLVGSGGMGEVYRAKDSRLGRYVALKVLPDLFAGDPDRLARFHREAQLLASLNHPNIAQIYGLEGRERDEGPEGPERPLALVMELVEGPTLADRVAKGPMPLNEVLPIARQIAEALEAAHEQGIIHRDLKPANIKVREDGTVKVLDFGLAKLVSPDHGPAEAGPHVRDSGLHVPEEGARGSRLQADLTNSPTITSPAMMTGVGVILGTAAYMSPEQAKGRPADKRSDLWAFGCVLYKMLTGTRPFAGDDVTESLAAILMRAPDWSLLPAETPAPIRSLIASCLEKDRRKRVGDIAVATFLLDERRDAIGEGFSNEADVEQRTTAAVEAERRKLMRFAGRRSLLVGAVALIFGSVVAGAGAWFATRPTPPRVTRTTIPTTGVAALTVSGISSDVAITPDGRRVLYAANNGTGLFMRDLDRLDPVALTTVPVTAVIVSPDGRWAGFGSNAQGQGFFKVAMSGGAPVPLLAGVDGRLRGATWTEDDAIVFATDSAATGLQRVSAAGGPLTVLTRPNRDRGEADHVWPERLPGGRAVLFTITAATGGLEAAQIAALDLKTGAQKILVRGGSHAQFAASGHLVYSVGSSLRAIAFDLDRLETHGDSVTVVPHLATTNVGAADFALATDGTLVYVDAPEDVNAYARTLVWADRAGRQQPLAAPPRAYMLPRLSPDATRLALWSDDKDSDLWMWDLQRATLMRFTFSPAVENFSAWTPDGRTLIFGSNRDGAVNLYRQRADGTGTTERLTSSPHVQLVSAVSPDGVWAIFAEVSDRNRRDIMMVRLDGGSASASAREIRPLVQTPFEDRNGIVSPDGRWLAYESDASGRFEIYVRPFPNVAAGQWQVSTSGGVQPLWARNGKELFYFGPDGALIAAPVDVGAEAWNAGAPKKILEPGYFTGRLGNLTIGRTYDVSPDGQRFLMINAASADGAAAAPSLIVVQNWFEELKRLVSTK